MSGERGETPVALKGIAGRMLPLIDLTSLSGTETEADILRLARAARTVLGPVAAVCLYPRWIGTARAALANSGVRIATVTNFPAGGADIAAAVAETVAAVAAGADEVDVVFPYEAFLAGDGSIGIELVRECRLVCRPKVLLKVILETGRLATPAAIRGAADAAIEGGADFIKTSTGKLQPGASLAAAEAMLRAIAAARARRRWVGFKASGGIRTVSEAAPYLGLVDRILGEGAAMPANFRFGASALLDDILLVLGAPVRDTSEDTY
ncbi:MAG TPA: deoxyribose-phosphate aldolase [Stellaceae bacterium]|nr:deoxyribose-phosphate aldolase [Stellaceae bacterium]